MVAPSVASIGQDVGDLLVLQRGGRGHHALVLGAVHDKGTADALDRDADAALFVGHQKIGFGEGRENALDAVASGLMARGTVYEIECRARAGGSFGGNRRRDRQRDREGEAESERAG